MLGSTEDLIESSGNYGSEDDLISCQYVHVQKGDEYECIEYEATSCSSRPTGDPTSGGSGNVPTSGTMSRAPVFTLLAVLVALSSFV